MDSQQNLNKIAHEGNLCFVGDYVIHAFSGVNENYWSMKVFQSKMLAKDEHSDQENSVWAYNFGEVKGVYLANAGETQEEAFACGRYFIGKFEKERKQISNDFKNIRQKLVDAGLVIESLNEEGLIDMALKDEVSIQSLFSELAQKPKASQAVIYPKQMGFDRDEFVRTLGETGFNASQAKVFLENLGLSQNVSATER